MLLKKERNKQNLLGICRTCTSNTNSHFAWNMPLNWTSHLLLFIVLSLFSKLDLFDVVATGDM